MRHRWKKIKPVTINGDRTFRKQTVRSCMECIHCGLMKGSVIKGWGYIAIYFKNNVILSTNRIPYKCTEAPNSIFISKKDFMV